MKRFLGLVLAIAITTLFSANGFAHDNHQHGVEDAKAASQGKPLKNRLQPRSVKDRTLTPEEQKAIAKFPKAKRGMGFKRPLHGKRKVKQSANTKPAATGTPTAQ